MYKNRSGKERGAKENIWLKKEVGLFDDEKCHLICFVNFRGLLGNGSAVVCIGHR